MEQDSVQCPQCSATFISQDLLNDHIQDDHAFEFYCRFCSFSCDLEVDLWTHECHPPHCQIVNLDGFWNQLMDSVKKRLEQTNDVQLKKADPETVLTKQLAQVTTNGFGKVDLLNNGIVVLKLMSKRQKTNNPRTGTKHDTFQPGIRVVARRIAVERSGNKKIQKIQLLGVYDETIKDQKDAYELKLKELRGESEEPRRSGYINGRPCHKGGDDNPEPHHYICAPQLPFMRAEKI